MTPETHRAEALVLRRWARDPWGHGGCRRSQQLFEILADKGIGVRELEWPKTADRHMASALRAFRRLVAFRTISARDWRTCLKLYKYSGLCAIFNRHRASPVLWEHGDYYAPHLLALAMGRRVVPVPHNFESLAFGASWPKGIPQPFGLLQECGYYSSCGVVFTISDEEAWLIRANGGRAVCLPYYPPAVVEARLLALRERRSETPHDEVLVIGTALNRPTLEGMQSILDFFASLGLSTNFVVAGRGTDALRDRYASWTHCRILGQIDDGCWEALHLRAKSVIAVQKTGVGALTRIPEALLAGIPVLANAHGARSTNHLSGVHIMENASDWRDALTRPLPLPSVPRRPTVQEKLFVGALNATTPEIL